jgi:hypothetical protein
MKCTTHMHLLAELLVGELHFIKLTFYESYIKLLPHHISLILIKQY